MVGVLVGQHRPNFLDHGRLGGQEEPDDGQGEFLLGEVGAERFARVAFFAPEVEDVVGDLEGDAEVSAVVFERRDNVGVEPRHSGHPGGSRRR